MGVFAFSPEAGRRYRAIGLMSGTSLDGVDAALITTDGERQAVYEAAVTLVPPLRVLRYPAKLMVLSSLAGMIYGGLVA